MVEHLVANQMMGVRFSLPAHDVILCQICTFSRKNQNTSQLQGVLVFRQENMELKFGGDGGENRIFLGILNAEFAILEKSSILSIN